MKTERIDDTDVRAARHAALGEPVRLRMVDLLTLGDLSPTELRTALDIPSNLVSHHLNVLETVGMIARTGSEGDRRRSYVQLIPSALDGLMPGAAAVARRVLFVCSANSARSQLAAALWRQHSPIPTASAGTHPADAVAAGATAAAARHGLDLAGRTPRALAEVRADDDFVITVCDNAHDEGTAEGHLHWSIPDPVLAGTEAAFDAAYRELERRIRELAPRLTTA